jgi:NDP-sugar pyrophosphorylase family protein
MGRTKMKAVVLAGGEGVRLRPLTYSIPKPLLPIGRRPILEIIIERLKEHGFRDIILNVGYKAELIEAYFRDGRTMDVNITYFRDDKPCGTCGPVKLVEHLLDSEAFVTMNGDLLTDLDFSRMYQIHVSSSSELTIAVKNYSMKLPYGVVEMQNNRIASIREKPELEFLINAGIYVLSPSALEIVPEDEFFDMTDLIQELIDQRRKVEAYCIDCEWQDLGTMESYQEVNEAYLETQGHPISRFLDRGENLESVNRIFT